MKNDNMIIMKKIFVASFAILMFNLLLPTSSEAGSCYRDYLGNIQCSDGRTYQRQSTGQYYRYDARNNVQEVCGYNYLGHYVCN